MKTTEEYSKLNTDYVFGYTQEYEKKQWEKINHPSFLRKIFHKIFLRNWDLEDWYLPRHHPGGRS